MTVATSSGKRFATVVGVAVLAVATAGLLPVAEPRPQQPADAAPARPCGEDVAATPAGSRSPSPIASELRAGPLAIGSPADPASSMAVYPITIVLDGPREWCVGIPVALVWRVDAATGASLQSNAHTDAEGSATWPVARSTTSPSWAWADLDFPTLGQAAVACPIDSGRVVLPMVLPAFVDLAVTAAGRPCSEVAFAEVRAPAAREPAGRWHRVTLRGGRGRLMVECGIALEVRVQTATGRRAATTLLAPDQPEAVASCSLPLADATVVHFRVLDANGMPLVDRATAIRRERDGAPVADGLTTDATGDVLLGPRLPPGTTADDRWLVIAESRGASCHGVLAAPAARWLAGSDLGVVLVAPTPLTVAGTAADLAGRPRGGVAIALDLGIATTSAPDKANGVTWRQIELERTAENGSFAFHEPLPTGALLRLRSPCAAEPLPASIAPGTADLRMLVSAAPWRGHGRP